MMDMYDTVRTAEIIAFLFCLTTGASVGMIRLVADLASVMLILASGLKFSTCGFKPRSDEAGMKILKRASATIANRGE